MRKPQYTQPREHKRLAARGPKSQSHTREKQRPGLKKSLREESDNLSGKRRTKAKVLVVHRIGFVRSGVLSLIAKSRQFMACGETDEARLARELFLSQK